MLDALFWRNRRVVVTGHTGFKGAWLTLWLNAMGARVAALALPPESALCLYNLVEPELAAEGLSDLRDPKPIADLLADAQPEIVFHLAAQALVRRSYADPCATYATNVLGTAHVLDAVRQTPSVRAVLVTTTDKVYENLELGQPFVESDRLGGHDPYSASKACTEILTASFRRSFFEPAGRPAVATLRAGNVIGGGDWAADRLVPDVVRALASGEPVQLRYPFAVRPWQHVLDPLAGYLLLAQAMLVTPDLSIETLNFAPDAGHVKTVAELVDALTVAFDGRPGWVQEPGLHLRESQTLILSADHARASLGWRPLLDFDETVAWTADWYRSFHDKSDMRRVTLDQITTYVERLTEAIAGAGGEREQCWS
jgi:CDP-glucose 4,6-dehydratase